MIKIAHLYYDLLNLYGEQGNIMALKEAFQSQNVDIQVDYLTIKDNIVFNDYDLVYLGSGSDDNLLLVLEDLKKYIKDIKRFLKSGKYLVATGNSYLLFGEKINNVKALNIFDYYAIDSKERIKGECIFKDQNDNLVIGFQNRKYIVQINSNHWFKVIKGPADNSKSNNEGYYENNFLGTFLVGPLFIRNPKLTDMVVKDILLKNKYNYHEDETTIFYKAYNEYLNNFYQ